VQFAFAPVDGVIIITPDPHLDERGWFARTFCEREFAAAGLPARYPQMNLSRNARTGTLRGLHINAPGHEEAKVIRCTRGAIFKVVIDLRPQSATFLAWFGTELNATAAQSIYVPPGVANGYLTLGDDTDVEYLMGDFYKPEAATGFRWNDPAFAVEWPHPPIVISDRDATYPDFEVAEWRRAHDLTTR
jgi:dTDP-4-dehydrorhamnose 3,5-epimerase